MYQVFVVVCCCCLHTVWICLSMYNWMRAWVQKLFVMTFQVEHMHTLLFVCAIDNGQNRVECLLFINKCLFCTAQSHYTLYHSQSSDKHALVICHSVWSNTHLAAENDNSSNWIYIHPLYGWHCMVWHKCYVSVCVLLVIMSLFGRFHISFFFIFGQRRQQSHLPTDTHFPFVSPIKLVKMRKTIKLVLSLFASFLFCSAIHLSPRHEVSLKTKQKNEQRWPGPCQTAIDTRNTMF